MISPNIRISDSLAALTFICRAASFNVSNSDGNDFARPDRRTPSDLNSSSRITATNDPLSLGAPRLAEHKHPWILCTGGHSKSS